MQNFLIKLRNFMAGRNGIDKLTTGLVVIYGIFGFIKIFFTSSVITKIVLSNLLFNGIRARVKLSLMLITSM